MMILCSFFEKKRKKKKKKKKENVWKLKIKKGGEGGKEGRKSILHKFLGEEIKRGEEGGK